MPDLDFHDVSYSDGALYILAVSLYPRDPEERKRLFTRLQISNTSIARRRGLQPAAWRVDQAVIQMTPLERRDSERLFRANVAAAMLWRVLVDGTTITEACKIDGIGGSTCWRYWVEFRPAAHLNAARLFSEPPDMSSLLMTAEDLRRRGEAHKMSRSDRWLLDATETWKVPEEIF